VVRDGVARWVLGGWQVNGILSSQTGAPLGISISNATLNAPGNTNRPNLVGSGAPQIFGKVGREAYWFDTTASGLRLARRMAMSGGIF